MIRRFKYKIEIEGEILASNMSLASEELRKITTGLKKKDLNHDDWRVTLKEKKFGG